MPAFTSETGFRARQRKAGLASARYWKDRGFANLLQAREARSRYAALRREYQEATASRKHTVGWFEVPAGSWECDCGLSGDSPAELVSLHREADRLEAQLYARRNGRS